MKTSILLLGLLCASVFTDSALSQTCRPGTTVFYSNGVDNTRLDAAASRLRTMQVYREAAAPEDLPNTLYEIAYNPTVGELSDLAEALLQLLGPEFSLADILRVVKGLNWIADPALRDATAAMIAALIGGADQNAVRAVATGHAALYEHSISSGRRVIVVAHSQGNLFALQAYYLLGPALRPPFDILAVATPAEATLSRWVTSDQDAIIALLDASPPNVDNPFSVTDVTGHGYLESYIAPGYSSREEIISGLRAMAANTPYPETCHLERTEIVSVEVPFERYPAGAIGGFQPQQYFSLDVPRFDATQGILAGATVDYRLSIDGYAACPNPRHYPPANACVAALYLNDFTVGSLDLDYSEQFALLCDDQLDGATSLCGYPFTGQYGIYDYEWTDPLPQHIYSAFIDSKRSESLSPESSFVRQLGDLATWRLDGYYTLRLLVSLGQTGSPLRFMEINPELVNFEGVATITVTITYRYTPLALD